MSAKPGLFRTTGQAVGALVLTVALLFAAALVVVGIGYLILLLV